MSAEKRPDQEPEKDQLDSKHPYVLYIALTGVLFLFLVLAAGVALKGGFLPSR